MKLHLRATGCHLPCGITHSRVGTIFGLGAEVMRATFCRGHLKSS